jgi:glutathione-regulated potassium-efflux system ancillary protein KefF
VSYPDWPEMDEIDTCPTCEVPARDRPMPVVAGTPAD